ncbi:MAG: hypothetical protein LBL83_06135 [Clostridiales bacterium]|jgi:hypothetical protein|nr:hypothetical protein [Clostridiales bacterium]
MSIKPVDLQVMIPKMTELARIHGSEDERHLLASQRGAEDTKSMVEADMKEVRAKKDAQALTLREKQDREQDASKKKKRRQDGGPPGKPGGQPRGGSGHGGGAGGGKESGSIIDIKL